MSFFDPTPPANDDGLPGISASEEVWEALIETLRDALNTFHDVHPDVTWGDVIHATKYLAEELTRDYYEDMVDA